LTLKVTLSIVGCLILFVAAVNVIWFVAPILGNPAVYRPLFGIVLVIVGSAVWRQVRE
jgi:hypothetical protein